MSHLHHLLRGGDGAKGVRDLGDGDEARPGTEQLLVLLEDDLTAIVDRGDTQMGALLCAQHLPGNDVGMVFNPTDDDLVVLADVAPAPTLRHEIDRFGRTADEYDLLCRRGIEKMRYLLAGILVGVCSPCREFVSGTMHIAVLILLELRDALDTTLRLLRSRRVVQPDERLAMHALLQNREIAAYGGDVKEPGRGV